MVMSLLTPFKAALDSVSIVEDAIDMSFVTFQLTTTDPSRMMSDDTDLRSLRSVA